MTDKLKPCPFCGIAPKLEYNDCAEKYYINCAEEWCSVGLGTMWLEKEDVIKTWNTRASDKELIEALEEALKIAREPEEYPSMQQREMAIINWKKQAEAALKKAKGE